MKTYASIRIKLMTSALLFLLLPSVLYTPVSSASGESREIIASQDLLQGTTVGGEARYVFGDLRAASFSPDREEVYQETFRIDPSATDSIAPANELEKIGIERAGRITCILADGSVGECDFGYARIEFMGEMKEGRVIFGLEDAQPTLGLSALNAIGFVVDPATQTLKRVSLASESQ